MDSAIAREGDAYRLLLAGDLEAARVASRETEALYRRSWEEAGPTAYGRLVGMLKAATLASEPREAARYVRARLGDRGESAPSWYALALVGLIDRDDELARRAASGMRTGSEAFARTADAVEALIDRDTARYGTAIRAIVADFESRDSHLTGVAVADTALVLERFAAQRGLAARPDSPLLPSA